MSGLHTHRSGKEALQSQCCRARTCKFNGCFAFSFVVDHSFMSDAHAVLCYRIIRPEREKQISGQNVAEHSRTCGVSTRIERA